MNLASEQQENEELKDHVAIKEVIVRSHAKRSLLKRARLGNQTFRSWN